MPVDIFFSLFVGMTFYLISGKATLKFGSRDRKKEIDDYQ